MLQYRDLLLESSKKQQLLDSALAKLDVEQAKTTKLQRQQAQREAEYAEIQQELIRTQVRLAEEQVAPHSQHTRSNGFTVDAAMDSLLGSPYPVLLPWLLPKLSGCAVQADSATDHCMCAAVTTLRMVQQSRCHQFYTCGLP